MTQFTTWAWNSLFGTNARTAPTRALDTGVPVADFLNVVSGSDYAPAYQAAIDAAYNNGIPRVLALPGAQNIGSSVYLDPPGNLRSSLTNPTMFGWSLELIGQGNSNANNTSTELNATFDNAPALWVGPGTGCKVEGINVSNKVSVRHPKLHNSTCTGIAISGGNGGAQRTTITRCTANGFYTGFNAGQNNGSLAERNYWDDCAAIGCYIGWQTFSSNDCINIINRGTATADFGILAANEVKVIGGEWGNGVGAAVYASMSSVSTITRIAGEPFQFSFTAVIGSPGTQWGDGVFNVAVLPLPHFGNVPLNITAWNSSTNTATFQIDSRWINAFSYRTGDTYLDTNTDFNTELQASTNIYACEFITIFSGPVHVEDWRIELSTSCTLLSSNTDSRHFAQLKNGYTNYDISLASIYSTPATNNYAHFLAQQSFPFIDASAGRVIVEDNAFINAATNRTNSVIINGSSMDELYWVRSDIFSPNILGAKPYAPDTSSYIIVESTTGLGRFDRGSYGPWTTGAPAANYSLRSTGSARVPYKGFLPERGYWSRVATADIDNFNSITGLTTPQVLPLPDGNSVQQCIDHTMRVVSQAGTQSYALAKQFGEFFTYGFPLTVSWNCKGQTTFLNITGGTHAAWLFAGLHFQLDLGDGSGLLDYVITGVYPTPGYITVHRMAENSSAFPGVKTTVYSGTTMGQQAFLIKKFGRQCEFATNISDVNGQTFAVGDQIWQNTPVAGGSPGWVCTTAGVAGTGAVFKAMANIAS